MRNVTKLAADGSHLPLDSTDHVAFIDHDLNIMVDVRKPDKRVKHHNAALKAAANDLFGHTDWRLGKVKELFAYTEHDRFNPALDRTLLPHTPPEWHWAPEVDPEVSDYAFGVSFGYGTANFVSRLSTGFVLPVRSLAAPASQ